MSADRSDPVSAGGMADRIAIRRLYEEAIVVDGSVAPVMNDAQLARMRRSGVTAYNWTICSVYSEFSDAMAEIAGSFDFFADRPDTVLLIRTTSDIRAAKSTGRLGIIFGLQNALPVAADVRHLRSLRETGIRIIQMTYNERNVFGDGCLVENPVGLTERGKQLIAEMNRLGILVDLSHAHESTMLDSIEASAQPVVVSHSGARSVFANPRNVTDRVLRSLAERDGVVGITVWCPMVGTGDGRPTIRDYLKHVKYVADLVGARHLAIGTDHSEGSSETAWEELWGREGRYPAVTGMMGKWFSYGSRYVEGVQGCEDFPKIADGLAELDFSDAEIAGILGGNLLRVFEQVWR